MPGGGLRLDSVGSYESAGVSLATAGAVVERLRAAVESTGAEGFGAFAALHPLDQHRLLAASSPPPGRHRPTPSGRSRWSPVPAASSATAAPIWPPTASTTLRRAAPIHSSCSTTSRPPASSSSRLPS